MQENLVIKTILNRKSVRQFSDKPVEKDKILTILRAGMSAPSARNRQPWKFVVVDDKDLLKAMGAELPHAKMLLNSPLGIVVCGDISNKEDRTANTFWVQDCCAAVENILIATEALGLGAVWTACYPKEDRVEIPQRILNLPEYIVPLWGIQNRIILLLKNGMKKILFIINIRNKNGYCLPLKSEGGFFPNPERVLIAPQALYIPFS